MDARGEISIGNDVSIAHGSSLLSFEHRFDDPDIPIRDQPLTKGPIQINDNVWIGAGCRILSDTRIESRTIVAANAVVTKNPDGGCIYGGVPARKLKELAS